MTDVKSDTSTFEVQAAYPLEDSDDLEMRDNILHKIAGRESDYSGCGASWAGGRSLNCNPFRDLGWEGFSFDEARELWNKLQEAREIYPFLRDLRVRVRPRR